MSAKDRDLIDAGLLKGTEAKAILIAQEHRIEQFSGPLPHPQILNAYEEITPGTAKAIVDMVHAQMAHRQSLEKDVVSANIVCQKRGQIFALIGMILAILASCYMALIGQPVVAATLSGGTLVAIVGIFVTGKWSQKAERERKQTVRDDAIGKKP